MVKVLAYQAYICWSVGECPPQEECKLMQSESKEVCVNQDVDIKASLL